MVDTSKYQTIIWRSWLDEAKTQPVYEAHVLFESFGWHVMGQGSTPNRAEKDAREALAFCIEHAIEAGHPVAAPLGAAGGVIITFPNGEPRINHVHPATKRDHA